MYGIQADLTGSPRGVDRERKEADDHVIDRNNKDSVCGIGSAQIFKKLRLFRVGPRKAKCIYLLAYDASK